MLDNPCHCQAAPSPKPLRPKGGRPSTAASPKADHAPRQLKCWSARMPARCWPMPCKVPAGMRLPMCSAESLRSCQEEERPPRLGRPDDCACMCIALPTVKGLQWRPRIGIFCTASRSQDPGGPTDRSQSNTFWRQWPPMSNFHEAQAGGFANDTRHLRMRCQWAS